MGDGNEEFRSGRVLKVHFDGAYGIVNAEKCRRELYTVSRSVQGLVVEPIAS